MTTSEVTVPKEVTTSELTKPQETDDHEKHSEEEEESGSEEDDKDSQEVVQEETQEVTQEVVTHKEVEEVTHEDVKELTHEETQEPTVEQVCICYPCTMLGCKLPMHICMQHKHTHACTHTRTYTHNPLHQPNLGTPWYESKGFSFCTKHDGGCIDVNPCKPNMRDSVVYMFYTNLLFIYTSLLLLLKMRVKKRRKKKRRRRKKRKVKRNQPHQHTKMMPQLLMMWRPHKLSNQYSHLLLSHQPCHLWMIIQLLKNQLVSIGI